MRYLLDANVFIAAKSLHYGFDFCPAFWEWLDESNASGTVFSIERVEAELMPLGDELTDWAAARGSGFFLKPDPQVLPALAAVSEWATTQQYQPAAVSTFLSVADYYLVAHALAGGFAVVTHELPAFSAKKIKIPNACLQLGVSYMTPFEMLRRERARFVLGRA